MDQPMTDAPGEGRVEEIQRKSDQAAQCHMRYGGTPEEFQFLLTRLRAVEGELAQYQRESADENECTKHPGAILAYGCSHCYADTKAKLAHAEQRVAGLEAALKEISEVPIHYRLDSERMAKVKRIAVAALTTPPPKNDLAKDLASMGSSEYLITTSDAPPPAPETHHEMGGKIWEPGDVGDEAGP